VGVNPYGLLEKYLIVDLCLIVSSYVNRVDHIIYFDNSMFHKFDFVYEYFCHVPIETCECSQCFSHFCCFGASNSVYKNTLSFMNTSYGLRGVTYSFV